MKSWQTGTLKLYWLPPILKWLTQTDNRPLWLRIHAHLFRPRHIASCIQCETLWVYNQQITLLTYRRQLTISVSIHWSLSLNQKTVTALHFVHELTVTSCFVRPAVHNSLTSQKKLTHRANITVTSANLESKLPTLMSANKGTLVHTMPTHNRPPSHRSSLTTPEHAWASWSTEHDLYIYLHFFIL